MPPPAVPELKNTCPNCQRVWKATDVFCRADGVRLVMGKQCYGCGAPEQPEDQFCWQCGLKAGEKPAPALPPEPDEDTITRLQKRMEEWKQTHAAKTGDGVRETTV